MQYVIYPDLLFLENCICNLLFLALLKSLFFPAATWKRILFAGFITALCNTFASILFFHCIWILKLGILMPAAGLMVCYCMQIRDGRRIIYLLYQMILWTLVLGGILQALEQWMELESGELMLSIGLAAIVFGILEKIMKIYRRQNANMRECTLYLNGHCSHVKGFADTGNQLMDPISKKPVSVISKDAWMELLDDTEPPLCRLIPYKSVGNPNGLIVAVQIDYLVILEGEHSRIYEQPMIAITEQPFTGIFHYSILLHSDYC